MNTENENLKNQDQLPEVTENVSEEDILEEAALEETEEQNVLEEASVMEEFAPEPIEIPNYNKEKEQLKMQKKDVKNKKQRSSESKKRIRKLRKIVDVMRNIFLFVLLVVVSVGALSSVLVKINTTRFSIEKAIRESEPERFIVGEIEDTVELGLEANKGKKIHNKASFADVIKESAIIPTTYDIIEQETLNSKYPELLADVAHDVIGYYVYGEKYSAPTEKQISKAIEESKSSILAATGRNIGETEAGKFGKYIASSPVIKELSEKSLAMQPAAEYTYITSILFSMPVIISLIVALMLLVILIAVSGSGVAHKIIGWAFMVSGLFVGAVGYVFKPMYKASTLFVDGVMQAVTESFNTNSLIYGAIMFVAGLIIVLVGSALIDDGEETEEDDYIDELIVEEAVNE